MDTQVTHATMTESVIASEHIWLMLYRLLRPSVALYVYTSHVSTWRGQEQDLIDDVLQETMTRVHTHMCQAEHGYAPPIVCLEAFCHTTARNYCRDLRRKEARLMHFPAELHERETASYLFDTEDPHEGTLDDMMNTFVITRSAHFIAAFPEKQRVALLTNLAHHCDFESEPTLLQQALLRVGIRLSDYQHPIPLDPTERGRHNTLVSIAYKRLKGHFTAGRYSIVA